MGRLGRRLRSDNAMQRPRRSKCARLSGGARTARNESRTSTNTFQRVPSSKRLSPGGKKLSLLKATVPQQGAKSLGLHPCVGWVVIALGHVARLEQALEPLEHQFDLPPDM